MRFLYCELYYKLFYYNIFIITAFLCHKRHSRPQTLNKPHLSLQGERLSHALGCAFAVCLEKKQIREKQKNLVSSSSYQAPLFASDKNRNGDSQFGSSRPFFRQASLLERISDPQVTMVTGFDMFIWIACC